MIMALELGGNKLVNELRDVIARRVWSIDLINFQRQIGGQVFGVPLSEPSFGEKTTQLNFLGLPSTTTAIYFWSRRMVGLMTLKSWRMLGRSKTGFRSCSSRFRFVSMNLDDLADGGEHSPRTRSGLAGITHEGGIKSIYKAYCRFHHGY